MTNVPELDIAAMHRRALASTRVVVVGLDPTRWEARTPCEEWTLRELLNHVIAGNWWAARLASGASIADVGSELDGDQVGDAPLGSYDASADAASRAFEAPGALETPCAVSYGPVPGSVYAGHRFIDVLVHGWDLAVASGQDSTLAPDLIDGAWRVLEPQLDMLRASGMFGDDLEIPADADVETRLLMTLGRQPLLTS